jgi:hypothetical protein
VPELLNIIDSSCCEGRVDLIKSNSIYLTFFFKPYCCCKNRCGTKCKIIIYMVIIIHITKFIIKKTHIP